MFVTSRLAQHHAHMILKSARVAAALNTLVYYGESQTMAVWRRAVACKTAHACHRTCLGIDISACESAVHTVFQGAVNTCLRQRRVQMEIDIVVHESIAQQFHLKLRRDIVV